MVEVKEMPFNEKFTIVQDNIEFSNILLEEFINKHLGKDAVSELHKRIQPGITHIPKDASIEEKYEIAYSNWINASKNNFQFIRERMGDKGLKKFEQADVAALKASNASLALSMLNMIKRIAPIYGFRMTAKELTYQLQWITPFSISEITGERVIIDIPRCKILDYPDTDDLCNIGCQSIYSQWIAEQLKVKMEYAIQGNSCTCLATPLN